MIPSAANLRALSLFPPEYSFRIFSAMDSGDSALHSQDDIDRIKKAVTEKEGPIYEGFKILLESPFSKMEYRMQGPVEEWGRAPNINTGQAQNDAKAAYQKVYRVKPNIFRCKELCFGFVIELILDILVFVF